MNTITRATYPIHNSKIHSHFEGYEAKMNPFGKVGEQLVVE